MSTSENKVEVFEESFPESGDMVNHPSHYQSMSKGVDIECIDAMRAAFGDECVQAFCICNAFKYLFRHRSKGGKIDLLKSKWYIDKYLELDV